jgi:S1-C subfamily serine protease
LKGEVIGINTAIADNAENIGFAIPVNKARKVMELLMSVLPKNPARSN